MRLDKELSAEEEALYELNYPEDWEAWSAIVDTDPAPHELEMHEDIPF